MEADFYCYIKPSLGKIKILYLVGIFVLTTYAISFNGIVATLSYSMISGVSNRIIRVLKIQNFDLNKARSLIALGISSRSLKVDKLLKWP